MNGPTFDNWVETQLKYHITHKTWYAYSDLAPVCHNLVHLAPRDTASQKCINYRLMIEPTPAFFTGREDYFGNRAEYFSIESGHRKLEIVAESTVDVSKLDDSKSGEVPWQACVVQPTPGVEVVEASNASEPMQAQLTFPSPRVPLLAELREYAAKSFLPNRSIVHALVDLNVRIHHEFKFDTRATTVDTPLVGSVAVATRRVPRFCPLGDRLFAEHGDRGAICEWLPAHNTAAGKAAVDWRRCIARVVFGVVWPTRLGRL